MAAAWDINTSDCPYDPVSAFGRTIGKLANHPGVSQEEIDILESMARHRTRLYRAAERMTEQCNIHRMATGYPPIDCPELFGTEDDF